MRVRRRRLFKSRRNLNPGGIRMEHLKRGVEMLRM